MRKEFSFFLPSLSLPSIDWSRFFVAHWESLAVLQRWRDEGLAKKRLQALHHAVTNGMTGWGVFFLSSPPFLATSIAIGVLSS